MRKYLVESANNAFRHRRCLCGTCFLPGAKGLGASSRRTSSLEDQQIEKSEREGEGGDHESLPAAMPIAIAVQIITIDPKPTINPKMKSGVNVTAPPQPLTAHRRKSPSQVERKRA